MQRADAPKNEKDEQVTGMRSLSLIPLLAVAVAVFAPLLASAQTNNDGTTIVVGDPNFKPTPIAIAGFIAPPELAGRAEEIRQIVEADLESSGLFRIVPKSAHISAVTDFDVLPQFADWRTIDATALVTGSVAQSEDGRLIIQYRVFDTTTEEQVVGQQVLAAPDKWRRIGHKVADGAYSQLTGEGPYFDSRVAFIAESGSKANRTKRLAIMDQDGANVEYPGGSGGLVLSPRFAPNGQAVLYISYDTGFPEVFYLNIANGQNRRLGSFPGMTFAPQFSPDGASVIFSLSQDGNTDIWEMNLGSGQRRRLTRSPSIETSPGYSPDGSQIVFESDRSGKQQLYVMSSLGGNETRISFGGGSYGTPVWSPKGDLIAFTKIQGGRFYIGVMRPDGSEERLLDAGFNVEAPTFSPNGRVLMYFSETPGSGGQSQLVSIDVTGINKRRVRTPGGASDPAWSPLMK